MNLGSSRASWRYTIVDAWGQYLTDNVELLVKMTGIPLDEIYDHLEQEGDDISRWIFTGMVNDPFCAEDSDDDSLYN
jgi:hypothetical protein